jgi:3-oxoacyl-[acyl-carrier protein] reductase
MFHNKNVVITGAGRGIGRALALGFAQQEANVLVHYGHAQKEAEEVVRQINQQGGRAFLAQADLRVLDEVYQLVEQTRQLFSSIDVWINNAGASANSEEIAAMSELESFERIMAVDVIGTWHCCRAAAPLMSNGGCILTSGWDHAFVGAPGFNNQLYAMSKGAIIAMTRSFARELAPRVRVNCIAPGWIENEWMGSRPDDFKKRIAEHIPLQRLGTPSDVVAAALFLASSAASYITGQVLLVNGGDVMR